MNAQSYGEISEAGGFEDTSLTLTAPQVQELPELQSEYKRLTQKLRLLRATTSSRGECNRIKKRLTKLSKLMIRRGKVI